MVSVSKKSSARIEIRYRVSTGFDQKSVSFKPWFYGIKDGSEVSSNDPPFILSVSGIKSQTENSQILRVIFQVAQEFAMVNGVLCLFALWECLKILGEPKKLAIHEHGFHTNHTQNKKVQKCNLHVYSI